MLHLRQRRAALGGPLPARQAEAPSLPVPAVKAFGAFALQAAGKEMSTTMAFVRLLASLLKEPELGPRIVPIVAALRPWLTYIPITINAEGLKSGFRRAREAAGLPQAHFHDLRHACATILLSTGADLYTIAKILGHTTIKVTERYAHHQVEAQKAALDRAFSAQITPDITPAQKKRA
jgi:hypothetical protein